MAKFALRTVHNGRVNINGVYYYPDENYMQYDGRLDGRRFAFGLYNSINMVSLWGTAEDYHRKGNHALPTGPHIVDGTLPWLWWYTRENE